MSDIRKQAERLVELESKTKHNGGDGISREEWLEISDLATSGLDGLVKMSRAYLAECEAHERTKKRLASAMNFIDSLNAKRMIITSDTFGDDVAAAYEKIEDMATKVIASIEQKEGAQDA